MAQLKSTNVAGNLSVTGDVLASKIIKLGSTSNDILLGDGTTTSLSDMLAGINAAVVIRGSVGTGGTITSLPDPSEAVSGDAYKVVSAYTYNSTTAKAGDMFICFKNGAAHTWLHIPSGDDIEDTWRPIKLNGSQALASGNGTNALEFISGTNIGISNSNGALTFTAVDTGATAIDIDPNSTGNAVTSATYDSTNRKILLKKEQNFARLGVANDLISAANTFTFVGSNYNGDIYINKNSNNNADKKITSYIFCNGSDNTNGVTIQAATFSGSLSGNATTATSANKLIDSNKTNIAVGSATTPVYFSGGVPVACDAYSTLFTSLQFANRNLSATIGGTTKTASIPTTLDGFSSITSTVFKGQLEKIYDSAPTEPDAVIKVGSNNVDVNIFKVYDKGTGYKTAGGYGFNLMYKGSGEGDLNSLVLYCDNQSSTSQNIGWELSQYGNMGIGTNASNTTDNYRLTVDGATKITGTLVLSKTTDADVGKDNRPALIVGGEPTSTHIEIDCNEILAKSNSTTETNLYLGTDSTKLRLGQSTIGSSIQPVYISGGAITTCGAYTSLFTSFSFSNRKLTATIGGTTREAEIPATLTGFTSITSDSFKVKGKVDLQYNTDSKSLEFIFIE